MNEAQKREFEEKLRLAQDGVSAANLDLQAQRRGVQAGLSLMPERIQEVDSATASLPYPISGTTYTAIPAAQSFPANTWVKVQDFSLSAPAGKSSAQLFLTSTGLIRYSGSFFTNLILSRVTVNGQVFPIAPILQTGFAVAGGSFTNALNISVEVYLNDPGGVTNDSGAGRENSVRTFTMAVWN